VPDAAIRRGLHRLLRADVLPTTALHAAADHPDLHEALARRTHLPSEVVVRCFRRGSALDEFVAARLVGRPLDADAVEHVLVTVGERRARVLAVLFECNVPASAELRADLVAAAEPAVAGAILRNHAWPLDERLAAAPRADGTALLHWLANGPADLDLHLGEVISAWAERPGKLDGHVLTCLRALARRPSLRSVPLDRCGPGMAAALPTFTTDPKAFRALLDRAEDLARHGRRMDAVTIVEAVAANPSAPLAAQRRCQRLARRFECRHLAGWKPAEPRAGPLDRLDADGQRQALTLLARSDGLAYRAAWSLLQLTENPQLDPEVEGELIRRLALDASGAGIHQDTLTEAAGRLSGTAVTALAGVGCENLDLLEGGSDLWAGSGSMRWDEPDEEDGPLAPWSELLLADCAHPRAADLAATRLCKAFGDKPEAWQVAFVLLRDDWDLPLEQLTGLVPTLCIGTAA
jgi:hypothetical protein